MLNKQGTSILALSTNEKWASMKDWFLSWHLIHWKPNKPIYLSSLDHKKLVALSPNTTATPGNITNIKLRHKEG